MEGSSPPKKRERKRTASTAALSARLHDTLSTGLWAECYLSQWALAVRLVQRVGVSCAQDAEDIVSDTFVRLIAARKCRDTEHCRRLFMVAVRNAAADWRRRRSVRSAVSLDMETLIGPDQASHALEYSDAVRTIVSAVRDLPLRVRQVFVHVVLRGSSVAEAASELMVSHKTVVNAVSRIRVAVRGAHVV